jgi:hypothetical protein
LWAECHTVFIIAGYACRVSQDTVIIKKTKRNLSMKKAFLVLAVSIFTASFSATIASAAVVWGSADQPQGGHVVVWGSADQPQGGHVVVWGSSGRR